MPTGEWAPGVLRSVDRALELEPDHFRRSSDGFPCVGQAVDDPQPSTSDIVDRSVLLDGGAAAASATSMRTTESTWS